MGKMEPKQGTQDKALTLRKLDEAEQAHRKALGIRQRLVELDTRDVQARAEARADLAVSHSNLAGVLIERKCPADAIVELTAAEKLLRGNTDPERRFFLGNVQGNLAAAFEGMGKAPDAEKAHAAAAETLKALLEEFPSVPAYRHVFAKEHVHIGWFLGRRGRTQEALDHLRIAAPILHKLTQDFPDDGVYTAARHLCEQVLAAAEEDLAKAKSKDKKGSR
jgi:tetratricopeptide (TPR) repeat protein